MRDALLFTAGLDSLALFLLTVHQDKRNGKWWDYMTLPSKSFKCIFVDYGHTACEAELNLVKYWVNLYDVELLVVHENYIAQYNPESKLFSTGISAAGDARNMMLALAAAKYADNLYFAFPQEKAYVGDVTQEFVDSFNTVLNLSFMSRKVEIHAPLLSAPKIDILKAAHALDSRFLKMSVTCWTPNLEGEECGECRHCLYKQTLPELLE